MRALDVSGGPVKDQINYLYGIKIGGGAGGGLRLQKLLKRYARVHASVVTGVVLELYFPSETDEYKGKKCNAPGRSLQRIAHRCCSRSAASLTGDLPLLCLRSCAACQSQGQVSQAMSIESRVFESLGLHEKNRPIWTCFFRMHQRRFEHPTHGLGNRRSIP